VYEHHSTEPVSRDDRRADPRAATVFRPVLIEAQGQSVFCLVRNLSATGMRAKVYSAFAENTSVVVEFAEGQQVQGNLIWQRDDHIGVRFARPIDVYHVLGSISQKLSPGRVNRPLRLSVDCSGELEIGGRTLAMQVQDISQRGLKVRASFVRPGDEVIVRLPSLDPRKAIVRWTQPSLAGLAVVRPLSFDELARWVVEQQMGDDLHQAPHAASDEADRALIETGVLGRAG
jgi:hypothetical protein